MIVDPALRQNARYLIPVIPVLRREDLQAALGRLVDLPPNIMKAAISKYVFRTAVCAVHLSVILIRCCFLCTLLLH